MFKYLSLSQMLDRLINKRQQLKTVIYEQNTVKASIAYSNLSLILNNYERFQQIYLRLRKKGQGVKNKFLLFVLIAEKINTKTIKGGGKLKKIVESNEQLYNKIQPSTKINKAWVHIRLRLTQKMDENYEFWQEKLEHFEKNELIPGMFNLLQDEYSSLVKDQPTLLTSHLCTIQSFSSALPPFLLFQGLLNDINEGKKFDVIDGCSAPGNKTLQLSELLGNRGVVFAFEKNSHRFKTLEQNMKKYRASNVKPIERDFLTVKYEDNAFKKVKLIMLDPSCSGSGMLINFNRDNTSQNKSLSFEEYCDFSFSSLSEKEQQRIQNLHLFQLELLCHAASFQPQRISYSTCSIYRRENEQTVKKFMKKHPEYHIKNIKKNLNHALLLEGFGKKYKNCVRVDPRQKQSDGFFVCILARRSTFK